MRATVLALGVLVLAVSTGCSDDTAAEADASSLSDLDAPPTFMTAPSRQALTEGVPFEITLTAVSATGDAISYALLQRPDSAMSVDAAGRVSWTPGYDTVVDAFGFSDLSFTVTAAYANAVGQSPAQLQVALRVTNDLDFDGAADDVDVDVDGDGVRNEADNCLVVANPPSDCDANSTTPDAQCDADSDGVGDLCDGG